MHSIWVYKKGIKLKTQNIIKKLMSVVLIAMMMAPLFLLPENEAAAASEDIRGVWVATVFSIDFPKAKNNATKQKAELDKIIDTAVNTGLNAVFFQVRPYGDALYKSSVYPWSDVLTGTQGKAPGFDPLAYIIESGKARGVQVHAWINPYRITTGSVSAPEHDISRLAQNHPVRANPDIAVAYDDGKLYLDPGEPAAQKLVLDGVREIIENYDVAGIHFDDYFYPDPTVSKNGSSYKAVFDDADTYAKYGAGKSLADWRRQNTYDLISATDKLVKSVGKNIAFGVSPSGIWDNKKDNPLGSDTSGFSSYSKIFADSRKWVKDGIVDYIAPQIYWEIGTQSSDYSKILPWWSDVVSGTDVKLYIGQAAYRVAKWADGDEIRRQLSLNAATPAVAGSIFYGYEQIAGNTRGVRDDIANFYSGNTPVERTDSIAPDVTELIIASPSNSSTTDQSKSYIIGAGIPNVPILVNGTVIPRTPSGYFALYETLKVGTNTFVFEHNGQTTTYKITRRSGGSPGGKMASEDAVEGVTAYSTGELTGTIKVNDATMRESPSSSANRKTALNIGMTDYIVGEKSGYYQFRYGGWTFKENVTTSRASLSQSVIGTVKGSINRDYTTYMWQVPHGVMNTISESASGITVTFYDTKGTALPKLPANSPLLSSTSSEQKGTSVVYKFNTKKENYLFGYNMTYENGYMVLRLQNPPVLSQGDKPLTGIKIHLDSGHGGSDSGATGPMGKYGPREYDMNMYNMLELKSALIAKGATVVTSNESHSKTTSQEQREQSVRNSGADIAISVHHNSVGTSTNVATVFGTETLYTQQMSKRLAQSVQKSLIKATGMVDRGAKQQTLFMCRFNQMPTVLVELGFVTNPYEYEKLTDKAAITRQINGIVNGVIEYFKY